MAYKLNNEKVLFTQLGDEGVIYDMESNTYISLNETSFKILRYVEEGKETGDIVDQLCREYLISEEECTKEVEEVLDKLKERGYLL